MMLCCAVLQCTNARTEKYPLAEYIPKSKKKSYPLSPSMIVLSVCLILLIPSIILSIFVFSFISYHDRNISVTSMILFLSPHSHLRQKSNYKHYVIYRKQDQQERKRNLSRACKKHTIWYITVLKSVLMREFL